MFCLENNYHLGRWVDNQRSIKSKLTGSQLDKLDTLGFVLDYNLSDNQSLSDELVQVFSKNIDNNISNVSITDTGSGILVDYAIDYFNEIYAGTPVITF